MRDARSVGIGTAAGGFALLASPSYYALYLGVDTKNNSSLSILVSAPGYCQRLLPFKSCPTCDAVKIQSSVLFVGIDLPICVYIFYHFLTKNYR